MALVRKDPQERKQELLRIAFELFATNGYDNTSIQKIVEAAGVTKGAFFYYFKDKQQVLDTLFEMVLERILITANNLLNTKQTAIEKIQSLIEIYFNEYMQEAFQWKKICSENLNLEQHRQIKESMGDKIFIPFFEYVIKQGIAEKSFHIEKKCIHTVAILLDELFHNLLEITSRISVEDARKIYLIPVLNTYLGTPEQTFH